MGKIVGASRHLGNFCSFLFFVAVFAASPLPADLPACLVGLLRRFVWSFLLRIARVFL
jgi:hypothetical protein